MLPNGQESKVLVVYFSETGITQGVAEHIANSLNADINEIVPENLYTEADLDYNDNNSRTTIEMNDPDARPAISDSAENMEQYTTVFIGYPIWCGRTGANHSLLLDLTPYLHQQKISNTAMFDSICCRFTPLFTISS